MEIELLSVILLLLAQFTHGGPVPNNHVNCCANHTSVNTNYDAVRVTCHFHENINTTKHNFNIKFYSTQRSRPETVLMCNWQEEGDLRCAMRPECQFDYVTSDQLTALFVTNLTSREEEGMYECQLVPQAGSVPVRCALPPKMHTEVTSPEPKAKTSVAPISIMKKTTTAGATEEHQHSNTVYVVSEWEWNSLSRLLAATNAALVFLFIAAIIIGILLVRPFTHSKSRIEDQRREFIPEKEHASLLTDDSEDFKDHTVDLSSINPRSPTAERNLQTLNSIIL